MLVHSIAVRLNLNDGSSVSASVSPQGNAPWIFPSDDSVDLAVLPLVPNHSVADYLTIPVSDFATDELIKNENIDEGSKIIVTGFFYQFPGERRMQPIVREGILAMMPDEDLETTTGKRGRVYLGDVHIFGGNSGSPVFVDTGLHLNGIQTGAVYLLGVVSGMFYEDEEFRLTVTTTLKGKTYGNSGIAMIVPATFVRQLLDDPRVQAMRDSEIAGGKKNN